MNFYKVCSIFLAFLGVCFFVQLHSMEPEKASIEKKPEIKAEVLSKNFIKIGGDFSEPAIVDQGKIIEGNLYLDLNSIDPIAFETFQELREEQRKNNLPLAIALITTIVSSKNKPVIKIYEANTINKWLNQTKEKNRYNSALDQFKDPSNKQNIVGKIKYYEIPLDFDTAHYLGSDEDLFFSTQGVKDFLVTYFKALKNYVPALNNLAYFYQTGKGVQQDLKKAFEYYKKAADQNYPPAVNSLGVIYASGKGVPQDLNKAIEYYTKAAEFGNRQAFINLGDVYATGKRMLRDLPKAVEYYKKAADLGSVTASKKLKELQSVESKEKN